MQPAILDKAAAAKQNKPQEGMPPLDVNAPALSFFEFWPGWRFYPPLVAYCLWLSLKYRGLLLPTVVNPHFDNGGVVGESKIRIQDMFAGGEMGALIPRYISVYRHTFIDPTVSDAMDKITRSGLSFPVVAKPDNGCRGAGVQKLSSESDLKAYIKAFPIGEWFIVQDLVDYECEAGIFYIRDPEEDKGRIVSLTLKYFPYVTGDGVSTLKDLILHDPRAGKISHLYLPRHQNRLEEVIPQGQTVRLVFSGTHSKGAIFKDGQEYITDAMNALFDRIGKSIPEFYFGRIDVRFQSMRDLETGKNLKIIEVNGATGEMTHIWDSKTTLGKAYKDLMFQYRKLYEIGRKNRDRGFRPSTIPKLYRDYRKYKAIIKQYPITH